MLEGRPHLLVVGAADTGRGPILAALLRQMLGDVAVITSAGVLGHTGEPADPYALMALEQLGIPHTPYTARQLDGEIAASADLLLAVDRATAAVLQARRMGDSVAISELTQSEDVADPHHMPLGIWLITAKAYQEQVTRAIPALRDRLHLNTATVASPNLVEAQVASPGPVSQPESTLDQSRAIHTTHLLRLIDTVRLLPEIVDWTRLVKEADERLMALAASTTASTDYTPAVTAMLAGLLYQSRGVPNPVRLDLAHTMIEGLTQEVDRATLIRLSEAVGQSLEQGST